MKRIAVKTDAQSYKIALLENDQLVEFYDEKWLPQRAGSIYKGKVVNVLPGMDAAFVDIGKGKNAFLHINDLLPAHLEQQPKPKPSIDQMTRPGEELLIQIVKEPSGTKGAKVTTHFSLPGRWIVYMPGADYVALSRKIESEDDKVRLRSLAEQIREPGEGIIVRTIAENADDADIIQELQQLREKWGQIKRQEQQASAPSLLYEGVDMLRKTVRDLLTDDVTELLVDDEETETELRQYVGSFSPQLVNKIKRFNRSGSLFEQYGIETQLEQVFSRKIALQSGSFIVIDHTEALTVIDVNTGKFTGSSNLEETVFQTNLEAAREIGRIIRLRDLGGVIIIDFIDMESAEHREQIMQEMQRTVKQDRNRAYIVGWTNLGLLEMTRKKVRDDVQVLAECTCCHGKGIIVKK